MGITTTVRGARLLTPAKIHPPLLRDELMRRPRLDEQLEHSTKATLVVAPAGYGKTVAVAHWAQAQDVPVAWFSIDRQDALPARFWRYVAAAIGRVAPPLGDETLAAIDDWATDGFDAATVLLGELGSDLRRMVLVLDDLHRIDGTDVLEQLAHFVERSPAGLHFVLVSRTTPALPSARWRATQMLTDVGQEDLELRDDEARGCITAALHSSVKADTEQLLVDVAGGWPAALHLSCLAVRGRSDPDGFVHATFTADRTLSEYVVGEILDALPPELTDAVQALSILDHIDARRCEMVTGSGDGAALIDELVRLGLPLVLWEPEHRVYRFHDLFRSLVQHELLLRRGGPSKELLRRAAHAEEAAGDQAAAVRHLIAAGDYGPAFELAVEPAWEEYRSGAFGSMSIWLDQFPADFIGGDADRIVRFAQLLSLIGRLDEADRWNQAARLLVTSDDDPKLLLDLAISTILVAVGRGDVEAARAECDAVRAKVGDEYVHNEPQIRLPTVMTLAELSDEHLAGAASWADSAASRPGVPERARAVGLPARRAWLAFERGELREAERLVDDAMSAGADVGRGAPHAVAELYAIRAGLAVERMELDTAEEWSERAVDLAAELASPLHQHLANRMVLRTVEARSGARAALASAMRMLDAESPIRFKEKLELLVAGLECLADQPGSAERRISGFCDSPGRRLVAARVALAHGGAPDLRALLGDVNAWPLHRQIEASLLRHRARPTERLSVQRALELGAERGFVWTFLREGVTLRASLARQIVGDGRWRESAIGLVLSAEAAPVAEADATPQSEVLSPKERAVLEHLPSHRSTIEIAQLLYISANTVRSHVKAIYRKLDVASRTEAVRRAEALGLLAPPPS